MSVFLAPLGWLYGGIMLCRRWLYKTGILPSQQLPGFVVSVGNLEAGGTGKSPVVMALAEELLRQGARPAILTRGYRSGLSKDESAVLLGPSLLMPSQSGSAFHADEATMQAQRLGTVPVIIGSRRWVAAQRYLAQFPAPTHWILDDGFQHLMLRRQLDIVLLNAIAPLDNGRCIPAGRLRELPTTLQQAGLILLTRSSSTPIPAKVQTYLKDETPVLPVNFVDGAPRQVTGPTREWPQNQTILLALGIAHPARIVEHCRQRNYPISDQLLVGDHELFPWDKLRALTANASGILTTEKDYWRQAKAFQELKKPVYILPLDISFASPADLPQIVASFTIS